LGSDNLAVPKVLIDEPGKQFESLSNNPKTNESIQIVKANSRDRWRPTRFSNQPPSVADRG
jgi:hypothetical protein